MEAAKVILNVFLSLLKDTSHSGVLLTPPPPAWCSIWPDVGGAKVPPHASEVFLQVHFSYKLSKPQTHQKGRGGEECGGGATAVLTVSHSLVCAGPRLRDGPRLQSQPV